MTLVLGTGFAPALDGAIIHVPQDQPTIQAGIDAAVDGDTVLVDDGTWSGTGNRDLDFYGKAITVRSLNGPDFCTIHCGGGSQNHRAQGIEAWPVLCRSGSRGHILRDFAWPAVFDHCITAIGTPDSGIRYFDPTSETVGYPCLPANLEGSMGLVVREDSGNLVPMASGLQPELKVSVEAELCRSGILKARVREVYSLAALWEIRSVYRTLNDEERDRAWGEWISRRIPDATIQELNWINLHDPEKDLIIEYSLKAPGLVKRVGELTMLNPFFVQDVPNPSFSADQRLLPVSLESSAIRARQEVTLKLPPDLVLEESIEPCRLSYDFGTFTTSTTEGDGTLTLVKEYTVNHTTVPAARYSEVKAFFTAVNNVERTEILFVAASSEPSGGDSGSPVQGR